MPGSGQPNSEGGVNAKMKAARRQLIAELIESKPFISLRELEEKFPDVTSMTLRRDIEFFEKQGALIKVRGGARSMKFITATTDDGYAARDKENSISKMSIAAKAVSLVEPGRSYFIDSGTTAMRLAEIFPDEHLTVATPGLNIAMELSKKSLPIVVLCGGIINRESISVTGQLAVDFLADVPIDVAFLTPSGYSHTGGFTCGNFAESELKSFVVKKARTVVMLMDASKIDKSLPYTFCGLQDVDVLVTDRKVPVSMLDVSAYPDLRVLLSGERHNPDYVTKCLTEEELEALRRLEEKKS